MEPHLSKSILSPLALPKFQPMNVVLSPSSFYNKKKMHSKDSRTTINFLRAVTLELADELTLNCSRFQGTS